MLYITAPFVTGFARVNMIDTTNGTDGQYTPYSDAPNWIKNPAKIGLISCQDKHKDARMFYVGDHRNEMAINRDMMVFANPKTANIPDWLIGWLGADGLAAALSTAAGLRFIISTSISHDLVKKGLRPEMTEKQALLTARLGAGMVVLAAGYLDMNSRVFVAQVVAFAFGLATASFFRAIILGVFDTCMNNLGVVSGMVADIEFTAG